MHKQICGPTVNFDLRQASRTRKNYTYMYLVQLGVFNFFNFIINSCRETKIGFRAIVVVVVVVVQK